MNLKEKLTEAQEALAEVKTAVENGEKNADDLEQAIANVKSAQANIDAADEAEQLIKSLEAAPVETEQEDVKMTEMQEFAKNVSEMKDRKSGVSVHVKAATDVVIAPTLADIDKSVAPQPKRVAAADFFSNATISGNAVTYFLQGAYEGTPAVTAQGAQKPQNSTSFTPTTLPLSKIAAYIKETDEILWDADFLASEVQNSLIYRLGVVEDSTIVTTIDGTSGILTQAVGTGTNAFADAIIGAIMKIKDASAFDASVVILNPADYLTLLQAKDGNNQYYGGGYFAGAYGQGGFGVPTSVWGVPVFTNTNVTAGTALVAAREAVKVWRKGGMDVKVYEQNEDDAIYNRVTLLAEERLACAVVDMNGVCKIS